MPENTSVTVRVPLELYTWLLDEARREHRSLNRQIIHVLAICHEADIEQAELDRQQAHKNGFQALFI